MTRSDFIEGLRTALENNVSETVIRENMNFYNQYISEEISSGRSEKDVLEELGDPWVLAQTIIDRAYPGHETYMSDGGASGGGDDQRNTHTVTILWKRIAVLLGIFGILCLVVAIFSGIVSILLPIAIPAFIIITIYKVFVNRR